MLFAEKNQNSPVSPVSGMPVPTPLVPWDATCQFTWTLNLPLFRQSVVAFATQGVCAEARSAGAKNSAAAAMASAAASGENLRADERGMGPPIGSNGQGSNTDALPQTPSREGPAG